MRVNLILSAMMLMLLLTACSSKQNTGTDSAPADGSADNQLTAKAEQTDNGLLGNASPQTSALKIYRFDGENTICRVVFDDGWKDNVINAVNSLSLTRADENELTGWTEPCYGISVGDAAGMEIWLTYSKGLWIEKGGALYRGELNLATYFDEAASYEKTLEYNFESGISMPNSAVLAKRFINYCLKSTGEETAEKDGVSLRFVSIDGNKVTVEYVNNSGKDYLYGDEFYVQKNINGEWYKIPVAVSNYGFNAIAHILPAGESVQLICDLTSYGELENGRYRVVKEDLCAEFEIGATMPDS